MFLWSAVFAIGWLSPRPCGDCGKARPYDQLSTPPAAAYYRSPRDQTSAPAKALGTAIQHILWYSRASYELRWYRLPARMPLGPRLLLTKRWSPARALCYIFIPAAPVNLSETLQDLIDGISPSPLSDLVLEPPVLNQSVSSLTYQEITFTLPHMWRNTF